MTTPSFVSLFRANFTDIFQGSNFYRTRDKPKFILGHSLEFGFIVLAMVVVLIMRFVYARVNRKREERSRHQAGGMAEKDEGDWAVGFRYLL